MKEPVDAGPPTLPRVLITRARHQQKNIIKLCQELALEVVSLPCLDVQAQDNDLDLELISRSELALFTSRNAVDFAHDCVPLPWPEIAVHAIGNATGEALARLQQPLVQPPVAPYTSEAFIQWLSQQPKLMSAIIIKGTGGRNAVEAALRERGTSVDSVAVYRRAIPEISDTLRRQIFAERPPHIVTATSDQVLRNLVQIAGPEYLPELRQLPLIVNSDRCAELATQLGFNHSIRVADPPGDEGQRDALRNWLNCQPVQLIH